MAITLEDIYKNLGPSSISNSSNTVSKDIFELLADHLYDPTGKASTYEEIKKGVEGHFPAADPAAENTKKDEIAQHFHGLGPPGSIDVYSKLDDNYWKSLGTSNQNVLSIIGNGLAESVKTNLPDISVFPVRGPRITPSKRGTKKIDFFLNYTPPLVANQMVPYLDVKFITRGTKKTHVSTPGIIRFLLGSGPTESLAAADKLLVLGDYTENNLTGSSAYGMEMFLMPQTLTNMDALKPSSSGLTRLTNVKPFVPFASIEGFDISVQNAGAGAFAHKKGNLKLKIHDKARLSEISEFIKGSDGFGRVTVETTYGWSAPKNRGVDDAYSNFINENMQMKDKWIVSNSQFSFDASGQTAITLEMISQSAMVLQGTTMVGAESGIEKFYKAVKLIDSNKSRITGRKNYSANALTEKIFNAVSGDGIISGMTSQQIKSAGDKLKEAATSIIFDDEEELKAFKDAVDTVTSSGKGWDNVKTLITTSVNEKFKKMTDGIDPFLPNADLMVYFSCDMINDARIKKTIENNKKKKAPAAAGRPSNAKDLALTAEGVVSFGKVFLTLVATQVTKDMCGELQIFFYGLNDECGWSSGFSVAEFPIDIKILSAAYAEKIKTLGTANIQIETMLSIIADSHFSEPSALGYGMSSYYEDNKEKKKVQKKGKDSLKEIASFIEKYGDLRLPMIEMFTETVTHSSGKVIKRIHVYDKLNSPYGFEQQILDSKEGVVVATRDRQKSRAAISAALKSYDNLKNSSSEELEKMKNKIKTAKEAPSGSAYSAADQAVKNERGVDILNTSERGAIKKYLMTKLPTLIPGTNGSLILNASAASKTDSTQGAINLIRSSQGEKTKNDPAEDGLSDANNMPLRSVPMQVTLSTMGVPTAQLYQKYFIDFNTGTTIDNIYNCSQIQHSISQGKFTTNWTFIYDNGYARFTSPISMESLINDGIIEKITAIQAERAAAAAKKKADAVRAAAEEAAKV